MSNSKRARRYKAIEHLEDGLTAYLMINSLLDEYKDEDHPHIKLARYVARVTLNELLDLYVQQNSEAVLTSFLDRLNTEAQQQESPNV